MMICSFLPFLYDELMMNFLFLLLPTPAVLLDDELMMSCSFLPFFYDELMISCPFLPFLFFF